MHELGIAQSLLNLVLEHLRSSERLRVTGLKIRIGELSAVNAASLTFCFQELARGTPVEGARIDVVDVPAAFRCRSCGHIYGGTPLDAGACSKCGGRDVEVSGGKELELIELQVE